MKNNCQKLDQEVHCKAVLLCM